MESDWEMKASSPEEKNPKRRMKTPFQVEALERVYAEDQYPTEGVRAELSIHLNLSDKQLQMWFCHRRIKDRKGKDGETVGGARTQGKERPKGSSAVVPGSIVQVSSTRVGAHVKTGTVGLEEHYRRIANGPTSPLRTGLLEMGAVAAGRTEFAVSKVYAPRATAGTVAAANVPSLLGESIRDDGPVLGFEFDPLPPGAFGSFIDHKPQPRIDASPHRQHKESRAVGHETLQRKAEGVLLPSLTGTGVKQKAVGLLRPQYLNVERFTTSPREFQFLPEQPSLREKTSQGQLQLNLATVSDGCYEKHLPQGPFLPSNFPLVSGHMSGFQQGSGDGVAIPQFLESERRVSYGANRQFGESEKEGSQHNFETKWGRGAHQSVLQSIGTNQPFVHSESLLLFQEHEHARMEKKRKSEEIKAAKELEAHEKRVRRDLERQEIERRKREDQMKRELEKLDREKRKDEDRANRERQREQERLQREEERLQREQRREIERQEQILLKENRRIEKELRKEEARKVKEAARLKVTSERAAAKRISKDTVGTIDDEKLEFLEATVTNGLDNGDCQRMDASKLRLKEFPPSTVRMKELLSCGSWNNLENAVGDLLMVWRFLTTFADVLGLWSFTLDEFAEALHDFDPRLLSEIHISLLKMIVKDMEEAIRVAGPVVAGSQNAITLASGGHPQLVEMAHEWGFDIQEWGRQLSPLTWPEILRQLALAAGYGPNWRECNTKTSQPTEDCEDQTDVENAVTNLRSGAAAASAVAVMQGKGIGLSRRCRQRLTPGTVKYAAFHILSLEGEKGLTILEVAEKIQKSGLRDLTTTKTPEASIAAALSRDARLFERVAPSTYSVRCGFRKDAKDTEEVLQSARERIRLFQSGVLDVEDTEKETDEVEEVERDKGYDTDSQNIEEGDGDPFEAKGSDAKPEKHRESLEFFHTLPSQEIEIDQGLMGEPWVQGLMEGEYSDLSVEERLMALVALLNLANEGNSIRQALEARMEAASAVKRQIWTEAQIERRRRKEGQLLQPQSVPLSSKNEGGEMPATLDGGSNSSAKIDNETTLELNSVSNESISALETLPTSEIFPCLHEKSLPMHEKSFASQEGLILKENSTVPGHAIDRPRAHFKPQSENCAEKLYDIRSLPLGIDRRRNRYWQFVCAGGQDPGEGRIYFECSSDGHWGVIDSEEALNALMLSLDIRGTREAALHAVLVRLEDSLRMAMRNAATSVGFTAIPDLTTPGTDFDGLRRDRGCDMLNSITQQDSPFSRLGLEDAGAIFGDRGQNNPGQQDLYERLKQFEHWIWREHSWARSAWRRNHRKKESDLLSACAKCYDLYWTIDKRCQFCDSKLAKIQEKRGSYTREMEGKMKDSPWRIFPEFLTAVPLRIQILKSDIISMEVIIPPEAFQDIWDLRHRKAWASGVKGASTTTELFQSLAKLEKRIKLDWLSSCDNTTKAVRGDKFTSLKAAIQDTPWVPCTSAAISLRVMKFYTSLTDNSDEEQRWQQQEDDMHPTTGISASKSTADCLAADDGVNEEKDDIVKDENGSRGRMRSRGGPKSRSIHGGRNNNARLGIKKGSKSKMQLSGLLRAGTERSGSRKNRGID